MERINWKRIFYHILFWSVYVALNSAIICVVYRVPLIPGFQKQITVETVALPFKILYVYFIFYFVIPHYLERKKWGRMLLFALGGFLITLALNRFEYVYVLIPLFFPKSSASLFGADDLIISSFDIFITLVAASCIKLLRTHYKSLEFEKELLREKLQSELSFLRAQTNPHFLFNTLNNIYVLARKKSDLTPEAIMMLSKVMRFLLFDCRAQRIPVANEAKAIQDLIEIEKLRYSQQRLTVHYSDTIENSDMQISPLLLLPFVENSFKHGASSTTGKAVINIRLHLIGNRLQFTVDNTVDGSGPRSERGGIGLQNVQRQLELIYPERHYLEYGLNEGWFKVFLSINLEEENYEN